MSGAKVLTETDERSPVAVVFGGEEVGAELQKSLEEKGIRVVRIVGSRAVLPILERPRYVFYFLKRAEVEESLGQFGEAVESAARAKAKVILVHEPLSREQKGKLLRRGMEAEERLGTIEVKSGFEKDPETPEIVERILRTAFSAGTMARQVVLGKEKEGRFSRLGEGEEAELPKVSTQEVLEKVVAAEELVKRKTVKRLLTAKTVWTSLVITLVILMVFSPVLVVGGLTIGGLMKLNTAKEKIEKGDFEAGRQEARAAGEYFGRARGTVEKLGPVLNIGPAKSGAERYFEVLGIGEETAGLLDRAGKLMPLAATLPKAIIRPEVEEDIEKVTLELGRELRVLDQELGALEGRLNKVTEEEFKGLTAILGVSPERVVEVREELPEIRGMIRKTEVFLEVLPEVVGLGRNPGRRSYLVVFQNSAELRPTGGFIGSYAILKFEKGKLLDFRVNDIYTADGQLRGRVPPPDEILHFLGQPNWYMRDANFSPDWPLSAERLEWFLEREVGERVDGVVGVDLNAVQKMIGAVGEIKLVDFNETVTQENFFEKAEYQAEINFFPGSTRKRDFLGAVAVGLFEKITSDQGGDLFKLGRGVGEAVAEKNILVYFNQPNLQERMEKNRWNGGINSNGCGQRNINCFGIVEANFGANKANYFIDRTVNLKTIIDKAGSVDTEVTIQFRNESPSEAWPGGKYKNYLRFLVPAGSKVSEISLGDGKTASVSSSLTAASLKGVKANQFLVYQSDEQRSEGGVATRSGMVSYGVLVEVPILTTKEIKFKYRPAYRVNTTRSETEWQQVILKQPGTEADKLAVTVEFPSFLAPTKFVSDDTVSRREMVVDGVSQVVVFPQRLVYESTLATDKILGVEFQKE